MAVWYAAAGDGSSKDVPGDEQVAVAVDVAVGMYADAVCRVAAATASEPAVGWWCDDDDDDDEAGNGGGGGGGGGAWCA